MGLPGDQLRGWHRSCNAVTLGKFATELQQRFTVGHGFHPFGDHQAAERGCQTEHAVDDGQVVGVAERVADEALVDLEDSSGQALEIGQRGIAGTKVVQGETDAQIGACGNDRGDVANVLQGAAFSTSSSSRPGRTAGWSASMVLRRATKSASS